MIRYTARLLSPLFLVFFSACHPWYLVESRVVREDLNERKPEVTFTRGVPPPKPIRIALLAPDYCADRGWAQSTGEAKSEGQRLQTRCGVDMAELERALVQRGWRVSSWKAVEQIVSAERVTALQAAKKLGANVMIQVNSFERSTQNPLKEFRWRTEFRESDKSGKRGEVVAVPEQRAQVLEAGLFESQRRQFSNPRAGASINVTAILVESGRSVWFYSWNHRRNEDEELYSSQLFLCNRRHLEACFPRDPATTKSTPGYRSGSEGATLAGGDTSGGSDSSYHQASREAISDLVKNFANWAG